MKILNKLIIITLVFIFSLSPVLADTFDLNVTSCSGGDSCSVTNYNDNSSSSIAHTIGKGDTGATDAWTNPPASINPTNVIMHFYHGGNGGITGSWTIEITNEASSNTYCTTSTSHVSSPEYLTFNLSDSGVCSDNTWTNAELTDLQIDFTSGDGAGPTDAFVYYATINGTYTYDGTPYFTVDLNSNTSVDKLENITFNATGIDPESDDYFLVVCSSSSMSGTSCGDTEYCRSLTNVTSGTSTYCEYNATAAGTITGYGFLCDEGSNSCNTTYTTSETTVNEIYGILQIEWNQYSDINDTECTSTSPCEINQYSLFNTSATITCVGETGAICGDVDAGIRYNSSGLIPDRLINETDGALPMFIESSTVSLGEDIVSYWKLDESSGDAIDSIGNNNCTVGGATQNETGKIGTAYDFIYTDDDYLTCGTSSDLEILYNESFSGFAWINPDQLTTVQQIIGKFDKDDPWDGWMFRITSSGLLNIDYQGTGRFLATTDDIVLNAGVWQHVGFVYNNSNITFYVNGSEVASSISENSMTANTDTSHVPFNIGNRDNGGSSDGFDGYIDEVGVWNRVLNESEVTELYNSHDGNTYPFSSSTASNTCSLGTLTNGISKECNWTINLTGSSIYSLDINVSSNYSQVSDNDTHNAYISNLTGEDTTKPTYSLSQTNNTQAGQSTLFSILYNDNSNLHPNGQYIFSTNNSGSWQNDSAINFTATPSWANVTKTLTSSEGVSIGYRWYVNDSAGNVNNTEIFTLTTTGVDTCTCPGLASNHEIDLSDNCEILDCNLSTGNVTFINEGSVLFNGILTAYKISWKDSIGVVEKYNLGSNFRGWVG